MGINTQIEVTDLHKSFGKNEVLKGITTKFEKAQSRSSKRWNGLSTFQSFSKHDCFAKYYLCPN